MIDDKQRDRWRERMKRQYKIIESGVNDQWMDLLSHEASNVADTSRGAGKERGKDKREK